MDYQLGYSKCGTVKVYFKKVFHADYFLYYAIENTTGNIINAVCYRKGGCNGH